MRRLSWACASSNTINPSGDDMKINITEAIELARQARDNGPCSAYGQALVHLLSLVEKMERRACVIAVDIERRAA